VCLPGLANETAALHRTGHRWGNLTSPPERVLSFGQLLPVFRLAGDDFLPRVNRLVLYVGAEKLNFMIAIGQDLAPLPTEMPPLSAD